MLSSSAATSPSHARSFASMRRCFAFSVISSMRPSWAGSTRRKRYRVQACSCTQGVIAADGAVHWFHMYAKPFYGADGHQDGALSTLRPIDDEVAAEQEAQEARRHQARAEARYRRSMDSAPIGMCLIAPGGAFVEVQLKKWRVRQWKTEYIVGSRI